MGCQCCRMIKSYIYDPSVPVDMRKSDSAGSSLYQPHHLPGVGPSRESHSGSDKHGFHNLGYSRSNDGTLKLEADNNHVNRMHATRTHIGEDSLYIIQPEAPGPRWVMQDAVPSQLPIYPNMQPYTSSPYNQPDRMKSYRDGGHRGTGVNRKGWDSSIGDECGTGSESLSADELDEGVGGTPEYPCDTGDEGSVLSGDIHTSTTSLSSADTRDERHKGTKTQGLFIAKDGTSEAKLENDDDKKRNAGNEDVQSITDSMVAEALAALEAATAGEDF